MFKDHPHQSIITEKGVKIVYRYVKRSGPCLVILHGLGGDLESFELVENYLPKNYSLLTLDQRGHGLSTRPHHRRDYVVSRFVHDLHTIIKKEKIRDFVLIGHCFGGSIAQAYCKQYGKSVRGLLLITSQCYFKKIHQLFALNPFFYIFIKLFSIIPWCYWQPRGRLNNSIFIGTPDINPKLSIYNWYYTSLGSWAQTYQEALGFNLKHCPGNIKQIPTKHIYGKKDWLIPRFWQSNMESFYQNLDVSEIDHGHMMPLNVPHILAKEIVGFVNRVYCGKGE